MLFYKLVNLFFPARCIFCRESMETGQDLLVCPRCLTRYGAEREAMTLPRGMGRCRYALRYRDEVRGAVLRFKFSGRLQYARSFAHFMEPFADADADLVTWVPIHPIRLLRRTYDQAQVLAEAFSKRSGIPLARTLRKVRYNRTQSSLAGRERTENVRNCYRAVHLSQIQGKVILLLDDVATTGATMAECARILYAAGAKDVRCIALAHGGKAK